MKDFFKTVAGKTLLFLSCTVTVMLCLVSLLGILFYAEEDFYINHKMTVEEYEYFSGKTSTKPNYNNYDPRSRTNKI